MTGTLSDLTTDLIMANNNNRGTTIIDIFADHKILRTHPPHINSSEEILRRITHRTLAQLRTNKSYLPKGDNKSHTSLLDPLCNTHTHNTNHLFTCILIHTTLSPLDLWTDSAGVTVLPARWTEKLAGESQA